MIFESFKKLFYCCFTNEKQNIECFTKDMTTIVNENTLASDMNELRISINEKYIEEKYTDISGVSNYSVEVELSISKSYFHSEEQDEDDIPNNNSGEKHVEEKHVESHASAAHDEAHVIADIKAKNVESHALAAHDEQHVLANTKAKQVEAHASAAHVEAQAIADIEAHAIEDNYDDDNFEEI